MSGSWWERELNLVQTQVQRAVKRGDMVRPNACETCGKQELRKDGAKNIVGHHDDYNEPLSVRWLCNACHSQWHAKHTAIPNPAMEALS